MLSASYRVERMQQTLRRFEEDIPLLNVRVKELSPERQNSARRFAAALIDQTRAELRRLTEENLATANTSSKAATEAPAARRSRSLRKMSDPL
jgi:hypothetical protein